VFVDDSAEHIRETVAEPPDRRATLHSRGAEKVNRYRQIVSPALTATKDHIVVPGAEFG